MKISLIFCLLVRWPKCDISRLSVRAETYQCDLHAGLSRSLRLQGISHCTWRYCWCAIDTFESTVSACSDSSTSQIDSAPMGGATDASMFAEGSNLVGTAVPVVNFATANDVEKNMQDKDRAHCEGGQKC